VERDDIMAEMTSFRANEKLLSALSRKSPQQFQLFLDALDKCGQRHVRNVITGRPDLPAGSINVFGLLVYCTLKNTVTKCIDSAQGVGTSYHGPHP